MKQKAIKLTFPIILMSSQKLEKLTFFSSSMSLPDFLIMEQILACAYNK